VTQKSPENIYDINYREKLLQCLLHSNKSKEARHWSCRWTLSKAV